MVNSHDIVNTLMSTEKGTTLEPNGQYLFLVAKNANKIQIKKAVEEIYKVKVKAVNTMISSGKLRRVRYELGKTSDWKKAIVTLQAGQKIEVK